MGLADCLIDGLHQLFVIAFLILKVFHELKVFYAEVFVEG